MSVVKYGLPVPGDEHRDPALLEMTDGPAPDVRLGDLVHRDGGHDPGGDPGALERILEGQAVHDRREHADVVAGRAVHAPSTGRQAAEDVAAADDDADLDAELVDRGDLARDERAESRIHAILAVAEEGLAGQLQQDALVLDRRIPIGPGRPGIAHSSSPTSKRTKRRTLMFSPIVAIALVISSPIVWSVSR